MDITDRKHPHHGPNELLFQPLNANILIDTDGHIIFADTAALNMFAYSEKQLLQRNIHQLVTGERINFNSLSSNPGFSALNNTITGCYGKKSNGNIFSFDVKINPLTIQGQCYTSLILRDNINSQNIKSYKEMMLAIIETSPDFIATFDLEGRIIYMNRAFRKILGYEQEQDLSDKTLPGLFSHSQLDKLLNESLSTTLSEPSWLGESLLITNDGQPLTACQLIMLHKSNINGEQYISTFMRDISDRSRMKEELKRAKENAEAATRAKSKFIATMSHEIRTSLSGLLGMAQLLRETSLNDEQQSYIETLHGSGHLLLTIVNDILDFSKSEAGKLALESIAFDLERLTHDVNHFLKTQAKEKNLELIIDYPTQCPKHFIGDPGRIRQILMNLINNALKFTEQGHILTRIQYHAIKPDQYQIKIAVQDTGIGIPKEIQAQLFNSFSQADTSTTRHYGGTGLGLAICKQLVHLMQGDIGVDSQANQGATFWFQVALPIAMPIAPLPKVGLVGCRTLLISPHQVSEKIISEVLKNNEMHVDLTSNTEQALTKLQAAHSPYQLIIYDHNPHLADCEQFAEQIKATEHFKKIPMMLLTSTAQRGDAAYFKNLGFRSYLPKPIIADIFTKTLASLLGAYEKASDGDDFFITRHSVSEESTPLKASYEQFSGHALLAEDDPINQQITSAMLTKLGVTFETANNGNEAIEKWRKQQFDVILMDCQMPHLDGIAASKIIRQDEQGSKNHLPIIALTANVLESDRQTCLQAGMDDFLSKPFDQEDLRKVLLNWLTIDKK